MNATMNETIRTTWWVGMIARMGADVAVCRGGHRPPANEHPYQTKRATNDRPYKGGIVIPTEW